MKVYQEHVIIKCNYCGFRVPVEESNIILKSPHLSNMFCCNCNHGSYFIADTWRKEDIEKYDRIRKGY
jgi:hypothetical protein